MTLTSRRLCGSLRAGDIGTTVDLYGWVDRRRDHGGLIFVDLRDHSGVVQVQFDPARAAAHGRAGTVRLEYVARVRGTVRRRPAGAENRALPTGEIEVEGQEIEVLNPARTPPFPINDADASVDEPLRLRYRYLDLRRRPMNDYLRLRHRIVKAIRDFLDREGFVEIETPVMIRSTPEGARDYLVPSRFQLGHFYALAQSPQLYKQLLMVGGIDRYFQIARCYRDEDPRADRQPEFTQLDLEMSFVTQEDVIDVTERCFAHIWKSALGITVPVPFARITHGESLARFGVDKPDLRYPLEIQDITSVFSKTTFQVFRQLLDQGGAVRAIRVPGGASLDRKDVDALTELARSTRARGLAYWYREADQWRSPIARFFTPEELDALGRKTGAQPSDLILAVADQPAAAGLALAAVRRQVAQRLNLIPTGRWDFVWIVDFPMFARNADTGRLEPEHHPFTAPRPQDLHLMETEPLAVRSQHYDLVLNGTELGSGSIRIHDRQLQERVFATLGMTPQQTQERFGFLLEAFEYGAPPHGGIAPGIDRVVMLAAGVDTIREVIAFPKTQQAQELMTGAPAPVDPSQLRELGLELRRPDSKR